MHERTTKPPRPAIPAAVNRVDWKLLGFAILFGCVLGLALLKFGNPIILDRLIDRPKDFWEYAFQPWPLRWGYMFLSGCVVLGATAARFDAGIPKWVIALPCAWFGWQVLASATSINARLTQVTLFHFGACILCFLLGLFVLQQLKHLQAFWIPVLLAFIAVLWIGFEQHYGGLEATRKMFFQQPNWQQFSAEYIKRIEGNRIFSSLVYPNALAAAILLLLPAILVSTWRATAKLTHITRGVLTGVVAYAAFACLFWSGSKSGWLIGLVLILALLLREPVPKLIKATVLGLVLVVGLAGFGVKFASYFRRGAPSVSARFEYWQAALRTANEHPVFGTGPGTFAVAYKKIKPAGAEMAQLAHNDYLEQASDSGVIGFLTYTTFILGSVVLLGRFKQVVARIDLFAVWLGLLGWSLQSFVEFLLYIPALAWTAFALFGWLWGVCLRERQ